MKMKSISNFQIVFFKLLSLRKLCQSQSDAIAKLKSIIDQLEEKIQGVDLEKEAIKEAYCQLQEKYTSLLEDRKQSSLNQEIQNGTYSV